MQLLASAADQGWSSESVVTPAPGAASRPDRGGQRFENNENEHGKKKENKYTKIMKYFIILNIFLCTNKSKFSNIHKMFIVVSS